MEEKSVRETLLEIHQSLKPLAELSAAIITQAELQAYTENLYNQLVQVAYDGISYLKKLEVGQIVTQEMVNERDALLARAHRLILDAPNAH
ncbi:hypothetical protein [Dictyobacter aurantiacus]|uniref:Uncharacterized protein n=1 Tax=Dictyobacter aurantiacus TaxID=1936993 RepID=A0A401ZE02_9CHLR|nr:hypothetical protein [Dictyobacter aurantiacus]GCE05107.1 hypothetical protein KDAU_24360 [Dictyobacter aurantiacus]